MGYYIKTTAKQDLKTHIAGFVKTNRGTEEAVFSLYIVQGEVWERGNRAVFQRKKEAIKAAEVCCPGKYEIKKDYTGIYWLCDADRWEKFTLK